MLRLQLQTMGSGSLRRRTPPPERHRTRCEALTAGFSFPQMTWDARQRPRGETILRALAPPLAGFPEQGRERPCVLGRTTPYKGPARNELHRPKKPSACRGIRSVPCSTLFSYWRHSRTKSCPQRPLDIDLTCSDALVLIGRAGDVVTPHNRSEHRSPRRLDIHDLHL
jgi:hypothetical protein